jgi:hypothetical protein
MSAAATVVEELGFAIDLKAILTEEDGPEPDRPSPFLRLVEAPAKDISSREDGSDPRDREEEGECPSSVFTDSVHISPSVSVNKIYEHREEGPTTTPLSLGSEGQETGAATGKYAREHRRKTASRQGKQETLYSLVVFNAGITVGELAEKMDCTERSIWNYLSGRPGYYAGLVDQEKVWTENSGRGRGRHTKVYPLKAIGNPKGLTRIEMLRLKWAKHENDRAEE